MDKKHGPIHNIKLTKRCPIDWDTMPGSEIIRTCTKCGALVLNQDQADTEKFNELVEKYKDPAQKFYYRRPDGKLMFRRCASEPNYTLTFHCVGWTGILCALLIGWNWWSGWDAEFVVPQTWWYLLAYGWNVAGAILLMRHMESPDRIKAIMFLSILPIAVLEIFAIMQIGLHIYWGLIVPSQ
jgi:hypothetical protein